MVATKGGNEKGLLFTCFRGETERGSNPELDFLFSLIAVPPDRLQGFEGALCRNRLVNGVHSVVCTGVGWKANGV